MNNPLPVELTQWTWVKVATNVTTGAIFRLNQHQQYYQTFRLTGDTAPSVPTPGTLPEEAVEIFVTGTHEDIESSEPIDVYILSVDEDPNLAATKGKVRADL
jgi:hypothetical protein